MNVQQQYAEEASIEVNTPIGDASLEMDEWAMLGVVFMALIGFAIYVKAKYKDN